MEIHWSNWSSFHHRLRKELKELPDPRIFLIEHMSTSASPSEAAPDLMRCLEEKITKNDKVCVTKINKQYYFSGLQGKVFVEAWEIVAFSYTNGSENNTSTYPKFDRNGTILKPSMKVTRNSFNTSAWLLSLRRHAWWGGAPGSSSSCQERMRIASWSKWSSSTSMRVKHDQVTKLRLPEAMQAESLTEVIRRCEKNFTTSEKFETSPEVRFAFEAIHLPTLM